MLLSGRITSGGGLRTRRRGELGTSIVEFALIFTLFFMLVGVVIQGAFLFNAWLVITDATREAARAGAPCVNRTNNTGCQLSDVQTVARSATAGAVDQSALTVPVPTVWTDTDNTQYLVVSASYEVPILAPFIGQFFPQGMIPISSVSTMRLENQGS
ncbi:MAG TPA: TadE/TadG family type IV pilus assembly protein [Chloroflexota bacterium]|nr:TadE/TadG family type IV pilus assembly protein [Chloroflexota bacterium]